MIFEGAPHFSFLHGPFYHKLSKTDNMEEWKKGQKAYQPSIEMYFVSSTAGFFAFFGT